MHAKFRTRIISLVIGRPWQALVELQMWDGISWQYVACQWTDEHDYN